MSAPAPRPRATRIAGLADQGAYALASFAQTALYARLLPPEEFGLFAMVLSTVLLAQMLQRCLVVLPMVVSLADHDRAGVRGWLRVNTGVLAAAMALLLLAAGALQFLGGAARAAALPRVLGLAALALAPVFLYEFVRRALYAEQQHQRVPLQSGAYLLLQLGGVFVVTLAFGTALAAVLSLALANLAAAAVGAAGLDWRRRPQEMGARGLVARYRSDMSWSLAAAAPYAGYNTAMPLLVGLLSGPAAAGLFSATKLLLAPITTLIAAVDSVDKPKAARSLRQGGGAGLRGALLDTCRSLLLGGGPYLLLAALLHAQLLAWVLGPTLAAKAGPAWLWLLVGLLMLFGQPLETGLLVLRRSRWSFWSRLAALAACASVLWILPPQLGHIAGVAAMLVGWLVSTGVAVAMLRWALRDLPPSDCNADGE